MRLSSYTQVLVQIQSIFHILLCILFNVYFDIMCGIGIELSLYNPMGIGPSDYSVVPIKSSAFL